MLREAAGEALPDLDDGLAVVQFLLGEQEQVQAALRQFAAVAAAVIAQQFGGFGVFPCLIQPRGFLIGGGGIAGGGFRGDVCRRFACGGRRLHFRYCQ